jgi:hypothetical protein
MLLCRRRGSPAHGGRSRNSPAIRVTSQYKGVSWNSACSKWVAVLWDRELKRARHIGSFESEEDAARAYDREAIKMLGPEAGLNFRESECVMWRGAGCGPCMPCTVAACRVLLGMSQGVRPAGSRWLLACCTGAC